MRKKAKYNFISSIVSKMSLMALGFILPRLFLSKYGSDTNGTLNAITQVFSYVALLEAGIGEASRNALYNPISNNDRSRISEVISSSRNYYRKITCIYFLIVIGLAFVLPIAFKTNMKYATIAVIVFLEGMSGVLRFWFMESIVILLAAEGKQYITTGISFFTQVLTYIAKIIMIILGMSIVQTVSWGLIATIIQIIIYQIYINRHYSWIQFSRKDKKLEFFKDRKFYLINQVAWTIFSSTDTIVISVLLGTKYASVYVIYNMVYGSLVALMNNVYDGLIYILGQTFQKDKRKYICFHDLFDSFFISIVAALMTCCSVLMIPFVRLYTANINDVEYIYYLLPIEFGLVNLLSWSRYVSGYVCCIGGYASETARFSMKETVINIVLSVVLGVPLKIYGILLATIIALLYKLIGLVKMANTMVLHRSTFLTYRKIITNLFIYLSVSVFFAIHPVDIVNIWSFIKTSVVVLIACILSYGIINIWMERALVKMFYSNYR